MKSRSKPDENEGLIPETTDKNKTSIKWEEFVAGAGGGALNVAFTYPIHKLMFRQMRHGVHTTKAFRQLQKEGSRLLYRGLLPPLCQKAAATGIMFGFYSTYGHILMTLFPKFDERLVKHAAAGIAGITEAVLLSPFERVQVLLQDKHYNYKLTNTKHAVSHIWKNYGILEFYRGISMVIIRNSVSNVVFFAAKEQAGRSMPNHESVSTKYITDFISGGVIGGLISTMYYPLNVIRIRMQCTLGGPSDNPRTVYRTVLKERGGKFKEMYRGVHLNYTRSVLSWGIGNASYELIRKLLYKIEGTDS